MIRRDQAHLFVVGFMGSGKSTTAASIAALTGRPHVDLDTEIEKSCGRSVTELFSTDGEESFRRLEASMLEAIVEAPPAIVSTGGGTYDDFTNRRRMRARGVTVWLDVGLEDTRRRVGAGAGRPLWRDGDKIAFRAFFERRRAVYSLADFRVLPAQKDPKNVAKEVLERFERFFD